MKTTHKILGVLATVFTIIGGIFAILQYTKAERPAAQADRGSVAIGGNVGGDVKLNTYDFDARTREKAEGYVKAAAGTCNDMLASLDGLTPDSERNMMEIAFSVPPSLQMTEEAATYYGDDAADEIETRLDALAKASAELNRIYMQRNIQAMTASALAGRSSAKTMERMKERAQRRDAEARASFDTRKKALLESTHGLCSYIQSMRPARKAV